MTTTRHWLEARRQELVRLEFTAGTLATVGGVLVVLGAGVLLARGGLYLRSPWVLIVMWLAPLVAAAPRALAPEGRRLRGSPREARRSRHRGPAPRGDELLGGSAR